MNASHDTNTEIRPPVLGRRAFVAGVIGSLLVPHGAGASSLRAFDAPLLGTLWSPSMGDPIDVYDLGGSLEEDLVRDFSVPGAARLPGTVEPGQRGVSVLAGHRTTWPRPFYGIDRIPVGEVLTWTGMRGTSTFRVVELAILDDRTADVGQASYAEVMDDTVAYGSDTRLNLYACTRPPQHGRPWRTSTPGEVLDGQPTSSVYRYVVFTVRVA